MEVLDVSRGCLTLHACEFGDGIHTLPNRLQGQGLFPMAMVFLPYFTSRLMSDLSLRRFLICQYVGSTILEALDFVCVWTRRLWHGCSHMGHHQVQSMSSWSRY